MSEAGFLKGQTKLEWHLGQLGPKKFESLVITQAPTSPQVQVPKLAPRLFPDHKFPERHFPDFQFPRPYNFPNLIFPYRFFPQISLSKIASLESVNQEKDVAPLN